MNDIKESASNLYCFFVCIMLIYQLYIEIFVKSITGFYHISTVICYITCLWVSIMTSIEIVKYFINRIRYDEEGISFPNESLFIFNIIYSFFVYIRTETFNNLGALREYYLFVSFTQLFVICLVVYILDILYSLYKLSE